METLLNLAYCVESQKKLWAHLSQKNIICIYTPHPQLFWSFVWSWAAWLTQVGIFDT